MNGRRYTPPSKRRKIDQLITGGPPTEESPEMEMAEGGEEDMEMEMDAESGPDAVASSSLMASSDMIGNAKVGDTVSFKVVSIDPKTGEGSLETLAG